MAKKFENIIPKRYGRTKFQTVTGMEDTTVRAVVDATGCDIGICGKCSDMEKYFIPHDKGRAGYVFVWCEGFERRFSYAPSFMGAITAVDTVSDLHGRPHKVLLDY